VVELITAVNAADRELDAWISERLRPLANQPHSIRLTVQAGGGKISIKREPPLARNE